MSDLDQATLWLYQLRRWTWLYDFLRWFKRHLTRLWVEIFRFSGSGYQWGSAGGFYSGIDQVERGERPGRLCLRGQVLPPLQKPSLIEAANMEQNGRQPWPVFWLTERQARLVGPSLALMNSNKELLIESVFGKEFCRRDPSFNYVRLTEPVYLPGCWTSLIHCWSEGYYHWIMDALPRLALLDEFPPDTGILVRGPLRPYQKESLKMLGLLDRVRVTSEQHLMVEEYWFTSPVGMTGCTNPHAVHWLRDRFLPQGVKAATPARFCIRRRGKTRGIRNQDELWDLLARLGWVVVDLEDLSFSEQITWFNHAECIIGEHGGGFTNVVWASPRVRLVELCADRFLNGCYEAIMNCIGGKHAFRIYPAGADDSFRVPREEVARLVSG